MLVVIENVTQLDLHYLKTLEKAILLVAKLADWIRRRTHNSRVRGSNPGEGQLILRIVNLKAHFYTIEQL